MYSVILKLFTHYTSTNNFCSFFTHTRPRPHAKAKGEGSPFFRHGLRVLHSACCAAGTCSCLLSLGCCCRSDTKRCAASPLILLLFLFQNDIYLRAAPSTSLLAWAPSINGNRSPESGPRAPLPHRCPHLHSGRGGVWLLSVVLSFVDGGLDFFHLEVEGLVVLCLIHSRISPGIAAVRLSESSYNPGRSP